MGTSERACMFGEGLCKEGFLAWCAGAFKEKERRIRVSFLRFRSFR